MPQLLQVDITRQVFLQKVSDLRILSIRCLHQKIFDSCEVVEGVGVESGLHSP